MHFIGWLLLLLPLQISAKTEINEAHEQLTHLFSRQDSTIPLRDGDVSQGNIDSRQTLNFAFRPSLSSNFNLTISLSICSEPVVDSPLDLYTSLSNTLPGPNSLASTSAFETRLGLAVAQYNDLDGSQIVYIAISAPSVSSINSTFVYELGVSTKGDDISNYYSNNALFLRDTDYSSALLAVAAREPVNSTGNAWQLRYFKRNDATARALSNSTCAAQNLEAISQQVTTSTHTDRVEFYIGNLEPKTNYSAILMKSLNSSPNINRTTSRGIIVYPIVDFTTKETRNCQIMRNLAFCDTVGYAVPISSNSRFNSSIESFYDDNARKAYKTFDYTMQQVSCEIDDASKYSLVVTCDDCRNAYKLWLCSVLIPKCADTDSNNPNVVDRLVNSSRVPAMNEQLSPAEYKEVQPCLDLCFKMVQACPATMQFTCPRPQKDRQIGYGTVLDPDIEQSCNYQTPIYEASLANFYTPSILFFLSHILLLLVFLFL